MKIPTTLKHKPVIVAENYDSIDGRGAVSYTHLTLPTTPYV